ncbi:MAG: DUF1116 domain-containing protein [Acidimicrobiales bacterium]
MISLPDEVAVINVGLNRFAEAVEAQGRPVVSVDWRIPGDGEPELVAALRRLYGPQADRVDTANAEVVRRLDEGVPMLVGVEPLGRAAPALPSRTLLHCGPPIAYATACDPLQRSMRAAVVAEGWAVDVGEADRRLRTDGAGGIGLEPANHHDAVVPMVTAIGPSQPVYVVENAAGGNRAMAPISQGPGATAWFGVESDAAIERLCFLRDIAGPLLDQVVRRHGPIDVVGLAGQGVQMGDDVHIRTQASTNLLLRNLLPRLVELGGEPGRALAEFLSANHLFFLTMAMAAARALVGWAAEVADSSIVTTMTRNGSQFAVALAGSDHWFSAPAPAVGQAMFYAGFGPDDGAPDVGDSTVLELVGLGGAAAGSSPSVAAFVGGTMADAAATSEHMASICAGESSRFKMPLLDFRGTPIGVDARRVVELGRTPKVTTGVLHASAGTGQIGAGVATAPIACFRDAVLDLDRRLA